MNLIRFPCSAHLVIRYMERADRLASLVQDAREAIMREISPEHVHFESGVFPLSGGGRVIKSKGEITHDHAVCHFIAERHDLTTYIHEIQDTIIQNIHPSHHLFKNGSFPLSFGGRVIKDEGRLITYLNETTHERRKKGLPDRHFVKRKHKRKRGEGDKENP